VIEPGLPDRCPRRCLAGCMRSRGKRRGGVIAWMLDDVELRELRIFLAVLVAAGLGGHRLCGCGRPRSRGAGHGPPSSLVSAGMCR
jgi:hypothetical protein